MLLTRSCLSHNPARTKQIIKDETFLRWEVVKLNISDSKDKQQGLRILS
jgi:hypothetical protein